ASAFYSIRSGTGPSRSRRNLREKKQGQSQNADPTGSPWHHSTEQLSNTTSKRKIRMQTNPTSRSRFSCHLRLSLGFVPCLVAALLTILSIAATPARGSSYQRPGRTERISWVPGDAQPDAGSYASVSADGRYVAFYTSASNLVPGDTNGVFDVFVRDTKTGAVDRV